MSAGVYSINARIIKHAAKWRNFERGMYGFSNAGLKKIAKKSAESGKCTLLCRRMFHSVSKPTRHIYLFVASRSKSKENIGCKYGIKAAAIVSFVIAGYMPLA